MLWERKQKYPTDNYLFKVSNKKLEKGVKYVQS